MNALTLYAFFGAPLLAVAIGYIAMRAFGYGRSGNRHHLAE